MTFHIDGIPRSSFWPSNKYNKKYNIINNNNKNNIYNDKYDVTCVSVVFSGMLMMTFIDKLIDILVQYTFLYCTHSALCCCVIRLKLTILNYKHTPSLPAQSLLRHIISSWTKFFFSSSTLNVGSSSNAAFFLVRFA